MSRARRAWLGHDTHVAGEVVRTADGLILTVRPGVTLSGPEVRSWARLEALLAG